MQQKRLVGIQNTKWLALVTGSKVVYVK